MADLPQQNTIVQYLADGVTTQYIVPFYTPLETDGTPDIDVYTQLSTATPIPATDIKIWNVDYTYTPNLDFYTGGIITFLSGHVPPLGYVVTIARDVSASLDVEFSNAQNFSGFTLDFALDKLLLISQQNKSYILDRNLSYIINTYLPEATIEANTNIPVLGAQQVWMGSAGGIIAATLAEGSDTSTLRSELANNAPVTNGAALVGYYDTVNDDATTVAAQLSYLTALSLANTPTGIILEYAGSSAPSGFLICQGGTQLIATYPNLFAVIGTTYGGDGITTFGIPDKRGYVSAGAGGTLFSGSNVLGVTGGASTVTMVAANIAQHTHTTTLPLYQPGPAYSGSNNQTLFNNPTREYTSNSGDAPISATPTPMNIVQPTLLSNFVIKT